WVCHYRSASPVIIPLTNPRELWDSLVVGFLRQAEAQMEGSRDMEELLRTLEAICLEHLVMRRMLRQDKQIARVQELCRLPAYRDDVRSQFHATFGTNLESLPNEITAAQLL